LKTIWTNGCYDIVHIGHIKLFEYAKSLGDKLIVGIDSDKRIKSSKGESRPINNEQYRKFILESIRFIDEVVVFDTSDQLAEHIKNFNIATIVVGDDYKNKYVIGSEYADVIFFPKLSNISTSSILKKI